MKKLDLDYAVTAQPYPIWVGLGLFMSAIALMGGMTFCYQALQKELEKHQAALHAAHQTQQKMPERPQLSEAVNYAVKTKRKLTYPWMQLFSALESIKQQHAAIDFLNIVPNKGKSEMLLEGEAKSFNEITHLLNDLKAHKTFEDAALVSQYLVEPESLAENDGNPLYTFKMLLKWRVE